MNPKLYPHPLFKEILHTTIINELIKKRLFLILRIEIELLFTPIQANITDFCLPNKKLILANKIMHADIEYHFLH